MYASLLIINVLLVGLFQLYMYYTKLTYSQFILLNLFFNVLWCMTHYYTIFKTNNTVSYGRNYTFDCYYASLSLIHYLYVCGIECTAVDNFHLGGCLSYLAAPSKSNTVPRRAINIIRSITVSNYTYNGKNIWYLFIYIKDELKMYAKFFIILLIYLLKHIIYQYCQFYLPTLGKLFLNIYFQTENTRTYILIVYFIHYTCLTIILCTCGMALLFYACIVYVECACLMSVYIVEPEASIGSERRRCFPLQTMFSCVWGCDISATFSCVIYIYMKHKHVLIFFHTTILCKQK